MFPVSTDRIKKGFYSCVRMLCCEGVGIGQVDGEDNTKFMRHWKEQAKISLGTLKEECGLVVDGEDV